ncbi:MAG: hypothetical protein H6648_04910 [Caldilineae bacterium]|nr:hypothetical protein [Chloroflexota bacterium]MCB9176481.1 hypothetical protein [Caldilineae bacterium]
MARQAGTELSNQQFVGQVARRVELGLADAERPARVSRRFSMVQVSYGQPRLHYEAWIQRGRGQVELGLHFEGSAELNGRLLQAFAAEMLAVRGELGPDFELEQWTQSWGRIHAYLRFERVDEALAERVGERLVATVRCLQPRLDRILDRVG